MDKYESEHNKTIERYAMLIKQLFGIALNEFAQVASIVEDDYSGNEMFNFDDYPQTMATVAKIVNTLANNMNVSVVNGCKAVWDISNKKNNALVESLFKGKDLTDEQKIRYFQNNEPALKAFTERKHNGLRLSDRVWNIVGGYKNDIETALSVSIEQGKSAHDLAKEVQQYLNEPDKLFRRVRDEFGELQLSKNAKSYHPGAGVYRSSYKNALRLARTEINMAYRTADFTRYQQLDFIVGIEIKTSGNHPEHDICDQLSGRYPKDFKFVGWHPNCRCYQKTILKTEEEMERDEERMRKGQEPIANSENSVNDVPDGFKGWVEDNEDKIKKAKSKPYFVTDNPKYTVDKPVELTPEQRRENTLRKAKERHAARTQEQVNAIKAEWNDRQYINSARVSLAKEDMPTPYPETASPETKLSWLKNSILDMSKSDAKMYDANVKFFDYYEYYGFSSNAILKKLGNWISYFTSDERKAVQKNISSHLDAVKKYDVTKIPKAWRTEYVSAISELNKAKNDVDIHTHLEHAYNIIKYVDADNIDKKYVSLKMPYDIFTLIKDKANKNDVKTFFDKQTRYTPYLRVKGVEGMYRSDYNLVEIDFTLPRYRYEESIMRIIYHEYGHADDYARSLSSNKKVVAAFKKIREQYKVFNFDNYKAKVGTYIRDNNITSNTIGWEMLGAYTDIVQAVNPRHTFYLSGHTIAYYNTVKSQIQEFIAHLSEMNYLGNGVIKYIDPKMWSIMNDLCKEIYK